METSDGTAGVLSNIRNMDFRCADRKLYRLSRRDRQASILMREQILLLNEIQTRILTLNKLLSAKCLISVSFNYLCRSGRGLVNFNCVWRSLLINTERRKPWNGREVGVLFRRLRRQHSFEESQFVISQEYTTVTNTQYIIRCTSHCCFRSLTNCNSRQTHNTRILYILMK
jgi:hypothetical protein